MPPFDSTFVADGAPRNVTSLHVSGETDSGITFGATEEYDGDL
jgi:hypothetical protein